MSTDIQLIPKTGKIQVTKTVTVSGTKQQLFKRAKQFVMMRDFGKVLNIKTHAKKQLNIALVKQPITYEDLEDGKIFGNAYLPFSYRGHDYFYILFNYRIYVEDGKYTYFLTDFIVHEIMEPGFATESRAETRSFALEDFTKKSAYHKSHPVFVDEINKFKRELKQVMLGQL